MIHGKIGMESELHGNEELSRAVGFTVAQLREGTVIPFLGAGANLVDRESSGYDPQLLKHLPSGQELARHLADFYGLEDSDDLVRVTLNIALNVGEGPLYERLRRIFDADYPPTSLHRLLARLPRLLRERGYEPPQIVMTTNYDDCLERAFASEDEEIDVLTYMAVGEVKGKFVHLPPDGSEQVIEPGKANEYYGIPMDDKQDLLRPVVLKLHGAVDRLRRERDSFVITEDDYFDYLSLGNIVERLPKTVSQKLEDCNFLFLGYSLRDWNLRALLGGIWANQTFSWQSWAIQHQPSWLDKKAWNRKDVEILDVRLDRYVIELERRIEGLSASSLPADA